MKTTQEMMAVWQAIANKVDNKLVVEGQGPSNIGIGGEIAQLRTVETKYVAGRPVLGKILILGEQDD